MTIEESNPSADYGLTVRNLDAFMRKAQNLLNCGVSEDVYIDEWRKVLNGTYEPPTEAGMYWDRHGEEWRVNEAGLYRYDPSRPQTPNIGRMSSAVTESAPFFPIPTPETWTVIGFWHDDEPCAMGAILGDHPVDGDLGYDGYQPWATSVEADNAEDAMLAAVTAMQGSACTPESGHMPGADHRWQECPTNHEDD